MNLEVFSCSGGMAEGFRRAGIRFDMAFDRDPEACASYSKNLGHEPIEIDVHDLLRMVRAGWNPGPVRLLVADPPCMPWSRAGKRLGLEDQRDMLRETAELIALLRPESYLIGNVPGLQDGGSWKTVQQVIGGLAAHGYCVDDYAQLDAANFGVPQHRIRPFWFGHLVGPCLAWPHATHGDPIEVGHPTLPGVVPLLPWVTCRQALGHLAPEDLGRLVRVRWSEADRNHGTRIGGYPHSAMDKPASAVTTRANCAITEGGSRLVGKFKKGNHLPSRLDEPALTITSAGPSSSSSVLLLNDKHPINGADRPAMTICGSGDGAQGGRSLAWPWDRPSTTITTDDHQPPPGRNRPGERYGRSHAEAVLLSELAAKILQGFPESWIFEGRTKTSRWGQIGMAMPPPLAEAVARAILERESVGLSRPSSG